MFNNFLKTEKVYSILELNNTVRAIIKNEFPECVWVCGEVQDMKSRKDKKHVYFNLIQKHPEADEIIAQVKAIIFENDRATVQRKIDASNGTFELKDDIEVKMLCRVDFYPKWGEYRLIVVDIDPIYTLGKLAQSRQKIIEELKELGLLDKNKSLIMPIVPVKIGLITAVDSAAYHDFISELKLSGFGFEVHLCNCYMQGKFVEENVLSALNCFNRFAEEDLDVIVITRGGGSTADLSYFDNKKIAESVALSRFPVISALGHEINTTITDFVAHTTLKTPTKAGQLLVELARNFIDSLSETEEEIIRCAENLVKIKKDELESISVKIDNTLTRYFRAHHEELLSKKLSIASSLKLILTKKKEKLKTLEDMLKADLTRVFKRACDDVKYREEKINLLNPKNVLKRGYSITFKDNKVLKSAKDAEKNSLIRTELYDGSIVSEVK